jgi:hypothetical protein
MSGTRGTRANPASHQMPTGDHLLVSGLKRQGREGDRSTLSNAEDRNSAAICPPSYVFMAWHTVTNILCDKVGKLAVSISYRVITLCAITLYKWWSFTGTSFVHSRVWGFVRKPFLPSTQLPTHLTESAYNQTGGQEVTGGWWNFWKLRFNSAGKCIFYVFVLHPHSSFPLILHTFTPFPSSYRKTAI